MTPTISISSIRSCLAWRPRHHTVTSSQACCRSAEETSCCAQIDSRPKHKRSSYAEGKPWASRLGGTLSWWKWSERTEQLIQFRGITARAKTPLGRSSNLSQRRAPFAALSRPKKHWLMRLAWTPTHCQKNRVLTKRSKTSKILPRAESVN